MAINKKKVNLIFQTPEQNIYIELLSHRTSDFMRVCVFWVCV